MRHQAINEMVRMMVMGLPWEAIQNVGKLVALDADEAAIDKAQRLIGMHASPGTINMAARELATNAHRKERTIAKRVIEIYVDINGDMEMDEGGGPVEPEERQGQEVSPEGGKGLDPSSPEETDDPNDF